MLSSLHPHCPQDITASGRLTVTGAVLAQGGAIVNGSQLTAAAGLQVAGLTSLQRTTVTYTAAGQYALTVTSNSTGASEGAVKVRGRAEGQGVAVAASACSWAVLCGLQSSQGAMHAAAGKRRPWRSRRKKLHHKKRIWYAI